MSQKNLKRWRKTIGLQCHQIVPQRVTILHDNRIDLNDNMLNDLNNVPPSYYWFQYEYNDA